MCGIAGLLGDGVRRHPRLLDAMGDSLRHRGPDGAGIWSDGQDVGLCHRRLAILDLSEAGHQPLTSHDARWMISFNGEIYNHRELRSELESLRPRRWRGHSDTEILVEAISEFGVEAALRRCEGMFALAAWDTREKTLHLARDRFGEKPLYVGWLGGDIAFASELRALRLHPAWRHAVEPRALDWYFQVGYVPAPWSIHPGVYKLPAATLLSLVSSDAGCQPDIREFRGRLRNYWSIEAAVVAARSQPWEGSHEEAMTAVQEALDASVRSRMLADVPVGAMLSGGIDSTLVVASMARQSSTPVKTYTIGFREQGFDESHSAETTARFLGTDHACLELPADAAFKWIDRLPDAYDEPFADAAQLPALLVSEALRKKVTVALTGDAGDELFQGYQRYVDADRNWKVLGGIPLPWRSSIAATMLRASGWAKRGGLAEGLRRQAARVGSQDLESYGKALMTFVGALGQDVIDPVAWPAVPPSLADLPPGAMLRWLDQAFALPEGIHTKLDRASMSSALELRVPFLDTRLFSLAWRLPDAWLSRGGTGKCILRSLASRQSPPGTDSRRKQGFDVPISRWLRGPLRDWANDLLSPGALALDPFVDGVRVRRMFDDHMSRRADYAHALWAVINYRLWCLRHG